MNAEEVLKLAKLARIEISAEEAESLSHEFEAILNYVGQVKKISDPTLALPLVRGGLGGVHQASEGEVNVLREDINPHESGIYTEAILENAPAREGDYIKVKKIL